MGCHFLLQGIFLTQGLKPGLLHCRQILYCLSHQGNPIVIIIEDKITKLQQRMGELGSDKGPKFVSLWEGMGEKEKRNK